MIINKPEIVDFIGRHIKLIKRGRSYWACCPFHHEKKPSLSVNKEKQLWHCFGCGAGGDVVTFAELFHQTDYNGALKAIGITPPETRREKRRAAIQTARVKKRRAWAIAEEQEKQAEDLARVERLTFIDCLICEAKEVMALARSIDDLIDILPAIHKLPIWEYERDNLLYG